MLQLTQARINKLNLFKSKTPKLALLSQCLRFLTKVVQPYPSATCALLAQFGGMATQTLPVLTAAWHKIAERSPEISSSLATVYHIAHNSTPSFPLSDQKENISRCLGINSSSISLRASVPFPSLRGRVGLFKVYHRTRPSGGRAAATAVITRQNNNNQENSKRLFWFCQVVEEGGNRRTPHTFRPLGGVSLPPKLCSFAAWG